MGKYSVYHKTEIPEGQYGELSKIEEEIYELIDAEDQGDLILCFCELSDIYGAFECYVNKYYPEYKVIELCNYNFIPRNESNGKDLHCTFKKCLKNNNNITQRDLVLFGTTLNYILCNNSNYNKLDIWHLKLFSDKTKRSRI